MPPHRDVVHDRHQVTAEDVGQRDEHHHQHEQGEVLLERVTTEGVVPARPEIAAQADGQERGAAVGDRRQDGDQPDEVEPAGVEPASGPAHLRCPPVDAAGGRVGRHQLGHAEADDQDEERDDRPSPRDGDRTTVVPRLPEGREAAGQDRDDGERDREVREPRPGSVQLLLVPELSEPLLVVAEIDWCRPRGASRGCGVRSPRPDVQAGPAAVMPRSQPCVYTSGECRRTNIASCRAVFTGP